MHVTVVLHTKGGTDGDIVWKQSDDNGIYT